jgi:hypothetical protein
LEPGTGLESPTHEDNRSGHRHHHEDLLADPVGQVRKIIDQDIDVEGLGPLSINKCKKLR